MRQSSSPRSPLRPCYVFKQGTFSKQGVNTALQGRCTYCGWLLEDEQINTENYMEYSNTLTLRGEHDKGQNTGRQMRKTQTDCSANFEVLHGAYRTTATEMLWIYSKNSCTAYTEIKPPALFKTKLHVSNTV